MIVRGYLYPETIPTFYDFDFQVEGPYRILTVIGDLLDFSFIYLYSTNKIFVGKFSPSEAYIVF